MPESRKQPPSKFTSDRNIPGAFEGETVTRRRFMVMTTHTAGGVATAAVLLPALGFAAGSAIFERAPVIWTPVGKPEDFPDDDYLPRVITITQGIGEVGKTTVYVRRFNDEIDEVIAALADGSLRVAPIVTHEFAAADALEAFATAKDSATSGKVLLRF